MGFEYTNEIICPYCEYTYEGELHKYFKKNKDTCEIECIECKETFKVIRHHITEFSTSEIQ